MATETEEQRGPVAAPQVMIYVQHLIGVGHLQRAALLANACAKRGLAVTLVSGGPPVSGLDWGAASMEQLPPLRALDETFRPLVGMDGRPVNENFKTLRREKLLALFSRLRPQVLVTEMFPFGRRQLRYELIPLLEEAKKTDRPPLVFSSVRDILVGQSKPGRFQEMVTLADRFYDGILVHGDPRLLPFDHTFPSAARLRGLKYTGYVLAGNEESPQPACVPGRGLSEVIVATGSREGGEPLLQTALATRPLTSLAKNPWRILTGINFPENKLLAQQRKAPEGVLVERFRPDYRRLVAGAALSISQAGYNSVAEVARARVPAVVIPYTSGQDEEQLLRARLFEARGVLAMAPPGHQDPASLAKAIERALAIARNRPSVAPKIPRFNGAPVTARIIHGMLRRKARGEGERPAR